MICNRPNYHANDHALLMNFKGNPAGVKVNNFFLKNTQCAPLTLI
jgi:hypothetical protein